MILAGDVGGTNTRLALIEATGARLIIHRRAELKNEGRRSFDHIASEFLGTLNPRPQVACVGVAGPVKAGTATLTNLGWTLDQTQLAQALSIPRFELINDLVAHAEGIVLLGPDDLETLHAGQPEPGGNRAILAPGTGLGEAGLVFDPHTRDYRPVASEGGHCDFSPTTERDDALARFVRARTGGRCSWEDVLSGPGLRIMYDFLTSPGEHHVASLLGKSDPTPADITDAAQRGLCSACTAVVEWFVALCGAEAGNLALKFLATSGVYIGGGIPPKILACLRHPGFHAAFVRKGPPNVHDLLRAIPIHLIVSPDAALYGAAHHVQRA